MKYRGIFLIIFLCLIPVLLLVLNSPQLNSYENVTHFIGQTSGLIGMTLFSITFVLSSRLKFVEKLFNGLDKMYKVHSVVGATAFVLLLIHPLTLIMKYIPDNFNLAAKYLLPGGSFSVDLGIIALSGMIILLSMTLYIGMKYHNWKLSHKFLGVFFVFAIFHTLLVRNSISRDNIFVGYYVYIAVVSIIGLIGLLYVLLLRPKKNYIIESITKKNSCYDIIISPVNRPIKYKSGQFAFVTFPKISLESHPFSIASNGNKLRFVIKILGDFTSKLDVLRSGDKAIIEGPYGSFTSETSNSQIWIAGGIGITPFLGMIKNVKTPTIIYYSVRNDNEYLDLDSNENVKVIKWNSTIRGRLTTDIMRYNHKTEFFICGPAAMKESFKQALLLKGINGSKIHEEDFNFK